MSRFAIACKLPNGLTIEHGGQKITLAGAYSPNARFGFGITYEVDPDLYAAWAKEVGPDFAPIKSGALFAFDADDDGKLEEHAEVVTGLEGLDPEAPAPGVEPTDEMKKELSKSKDKPASRKK